MALADEKAVEAAIAATVAAQEELQKMPSFQRKEILGLFGALHHHRHCLFQLGRS